MGFRQRLNSYGYRKLLLTSKDFPAAVVLTAGVIVVSEYFSLNVINYSLVETGVQMSISLTAFILTGLALLLSFSEFLGVLKEVGIYNELVFVFEFTIYLTIISAVTGAIISSYRLPEPYFYVFVFFIGYTLFSVLSLVGTIVDYGERKGKYERKKNSLPDEEQ